MLTEIKTVYCCKPKLSDIIEIYQIVKEGYIVQLIHGNNYQFVKLITENTIKNWSEEEYLDDYFVK